MKYRMLVAGLLMVFPAFSLWAQRAFTPDDLVTWERITRQSISDDGKWVAVQFTPWQGDSRVEVYTAADGKQIFATMQAGKFDFTASSRYLVQEGVPSVSLTDSLKLKKVKKEQMPMNVLTIHDLQEKTSWKVDSLKSYRLARKADWIAYQQGRKDSVLYVASLDGTQRLTLPNVLAYGFSAEGASLYFVTADSLDGIRPGLYGWTAGQARPYLLKAGKGVFSGCTFDKEGRQLAFLYAESKKEASSASSLWLSVGMEEAREVVTATTSGVPDGWVISPNGVLSFSEDGSRLFLGTAPKPLKKDTTVLDEYRPNVQVWSWDEPVQYTVQQYNLKNERKRTYRALYQVATGKLIQLADSLLPNIQLAPKGAGEWALVSTSRPYSLASMWEGRTRSDYYRVSLVDGTRLPVSTADYTSYRLSPEGRYAYGYCAPDSCWYTIELVKVITSCNSARSLTNEACGENGFREQNPLHKPYVNICKTLTSYAPIDPQKLRTPWQDIPNLREPLTQIGFFDFGDLHFEVYEGKGGHLPGEVVLIDYNNNIAFTGDVYINTHGLTAEQAEYNQYAPILMTSVDTDPKLCSEERKAIMRRLGVGNWKIFGAHGSPKDYCVK